MSFFKFYNFIYKLFTKRGKKAFFVTIFLVVVFFGFFKNTVFAASSTNEVLNNDSSVNSNAINNWAYNSYNWNLITPSKSQGYDRFSANSSIWYISNATLSDSSQNVNYSFDNHLLIAIKTIPGYVYAFHNKSTSNSSFDSKFAITDDLGFIEFSKHLTISNLSSVKSSNMRFQTNFLGFFVGNGQTIIFDISGISSSDWYLIDTFISSKAISDNSSSSGGGGSSFDYTNAINEINTNLGVINSNVIDLKTGQATISATLQDIKTILQNQNQQATIDAINQSAQATQNTINQSAQATQNTINEQTQQQQQQFNQFTNDTIDETGLNIDTSNFSTTDVQGVDDFIGQVFDLFKNTFTGATAYTSSGIKKYDTVSIPFPHTNKNLVLSAEDIENFYNNNALIGNLLTTFWLFIFGLFYFRIAKSLFVGFSNGDLYTSPSSLDKIMYRYNIVLHEFDM